MESESESEEEEEEEEEEREGEEGKKGAARGAGDDCSGGGGKEEEMKRRSSPPPPQREAHTFSHGRRGRVFGGDDARGRLKLKEGGRENCRGGRGGGKNLKKKTKPKIERTPFFSSLLLFCFFLFSHIDSKLTRDKKKRRRNESEKRGGRTDSQRQMF